MIWVQVGDVRVTTVPPNSSADIYSTFTFSGAPLPEGAQVKFLVGSGMLVSANQTSDSGGQEVVALTEQEVVSSITPIDGLVLSSDTGIVEQHLVADENGDLTVLTVAKVTMTISSQLTQDSLTVAAYSTYDKLGTVERLQADSATITVSQGAGVFLSAGEKYDPTVSAPAGAWTATAPMPTGRAGLSCEAIGSNVYAMGGFNFNFSNANEILDTTVLPDGAWTKGADMLSARGFMATAVYAGSIYAAGGYSFIPGNAMDNFEKYDTVAWTALPPLPAKVAFGTAQVVGTKMYVLYGGSKFTGDSKTLTEQVSEFNLGVLSYDFIGATWQVEDVLVAGAPSFSPTAAAPAGSFVIPVQASATYGPYGVITISEGPNKETIRYTSFNSSLGVIILASPLANSYTTSAVVRQASLPENRMSPNSYVDGTNIKVFNGQSFLGFNSGDPTFTNATVAQFDTATGAFTTIAGTPTMARSKAGSAMLGTRSYAVGGSSKKSSWSNNAEYVDIPTTVFTGHPPISLMNMARHSLGVATTGGNIYAIGGAGSGHPPGWLKVDVKADPSTVRADGKATASIVVTATDASGDPPPDGTKFKAKGLIYIKLTDKEKAQVATTKAAAIQSATGAGALELNPPPQKVSILPVLFSSLSMTMTNGKAATILLGRSEDPITEVDQLFNFVMKGEAIATQSQLKQSLGKENDRNKQIMVGDTRPLYEVAIEVSADDPTFFGASSTDAVITEQSATSLASDKFSFNPPPAAQGLSATVSFFSDIASIPDVFLYSNEVGGVDAKMALDTISEDVPFGSSPHFDALFTGAQARSVPAPALPLLPPNNIMLSTSDNDQNSSAHTAQEVVDEVNSVAGINRFPVFVTSFVVTNPVSLSARKARTDVAELELISTETGGNSFSVIDATYVDFVIERIKTSAPASLGSGTITATRKIDGALESVSYSVGNVVLAGNSASMTLWYSVDGYNFVLVSDTILPNTTFTLGTPIPVAYVRYQIRLQSKDFQTPILNSVTLSYVKPNVKYLFVYPQTISGQLTELASVFNHRLPAGGRVEVGVTHGDSLMFDRDYGSPTQPTTGDMGTIVVLNRDDGGTFIDGQATTDVLVTDDFLIYRSKTGPWAQDAITSVFVNSAPALPTDFVAFPEEGLVAFLKKLSPKDVVGLQVQNGQESFRVGVKVTNPTLEAGVLDSLAFMFGSTSDGAGFKPVRPPVAVNLFITPSPVLGGGPMTANYTFVDPQGSKEDSTQTEINWYRNGVVVPGLANKKSFSNLDIVAGRADGGGLISKGQTWFFSVRPSSGAAFGPLAVSSGVTIANKPPSAANVNITSSNKDPLVFTSADSLIANFVFADSDHGDASSGTIYTWFANGSQVKTGTSSELAITDQNSSGKTAIAAGAVIAVQVTPSDGVDFGTTITSPSVTIAGTAPSASNAVVLPTAPTAASNLKVTYSFVSPDGLSDQSSIAWFMNGSRVSSLDNSPTVASSLVSPGQTWQAVVTPATSTISGTPVKSNTVTIKF